jgi:3-hydroxyisobutyrate dehydrogenase
MGLVAKDIGLFQEVVDRAEVPLELNPLLISIFKDGIKKFGPRDLSPNIIRRMDDATGLSVLTPGFPTEITDESAEETGYEIKVG